MSTLTDWDNWNNQIFEEDKPFFLMSLNIWVIGCSFLSLRQNLPPQPQSKVMGSNVPLSLS